MNGCTVRRNSMLRGYGINKNTVHSHDNTLTFGLC